MKKITKQQFLDNKQFYLQEMKNWKIFIYPTDTILGIGCIVSSKKSVDQIFELKQRENKPLLIIIPNIKWLNNNCIISDKNRDYIQDKLPWAYSFITNLRNKDTLYSKINNNSWTIWIRIPKNWFAEIISELWEAFITTSVNLSGKDSILKVADIPQNILTWVDYAIKWESHFSWKSSKLIDMRGDETIVLRK